MKQRTPQELATVAADIRAQAARNLAGRGKAAAWLRKYQATQEGAAFLASLLALGDAERTAREKMHAPPTSFVSQQPKPETKSRKP